jgi:hypothetical protein
MRREEGQGRGYLIGGWLAAGGRCRLRLDLVASAPLVSLPSHVNEWWLLGQEVPGWWQLGLRSARIRDGNGAGSGQV